jgi:hypothetical protein
LAHVFHHWKTAGQATVGADITERTSIVKPIVHVVKLKTQEPYCHFSKSVRASAKSKPFHTNGIIYLPISTTVHHTFKILPQTVHSEVAAEYN